MGELWAVGETILNMLFFRLSEKKGPKALLPFMTPTHEKRLPLP